MQKSKLILLIIISLALAFFASVVVNNMMTKQLKGTSSEYSETVDVVVAASDISYGQMIQSENIILKKHPKYLVTEGNFSQLTMVEGQTAKGEIFKGEVILAKRLMSTNDGTILAALINREMRAVTVRVNDVIGVAGFLLPGNRVDVLASRMENRRSITRTVLENIKILAVDQKIEADKDTALLVRAVTMEVSPSASEKLFQAIQEGSIHLTLRNPIDEKTHQILADVDKIKLKSPPIKTSLKPKVVAARKIVKTRSKPRSQVKPKIKLLPEPRSSITVIRGIEKTEIQVRGEYH